MMMLTRLNFSRKVVADSFIKSV